MSHDAYKASEEERLNMTFKKLFSNEINDTLPGI